MRKITAVATLATLSACLTTAPAFAGDSTSRAEAVGVGMGATVGALAGGPVGFIVGAAIGAKVGDEYHQKGAEVSALGSELHVAEERAATLQQAVDDLQASLDSQRGDLERLQASSTADASQLLRGGVAIDLLFRTDEDELTADTQARIAELAGTLAAMPEIRLHLDGYADERGDATYNQELSERRARHVRELLIGNGVAGNRITLVAHGEAEAPDGRIDSYALERKVSMTLLVGDSDSLAANPE